MWFKAGGKTAMRWKKRKGKGLKELYRDGGEQTLQGEKRVPSPGCCRHPAGKETQLCGQAFRTRFGKDLVKRKSASTKER